MKEGKERAKEGNMGYKLKERQGTENMMCKAVRFHESVPM
jgi:hypothetical protein